MHQGLSKDGGLVTVGVWRTDPVLSSGCPLVVRQGFEGVSRLRGWTCPGQGWTCPLGFTPSVTGEGRYIYSLWDWQAPSYNCFAIAIVTREEGVVKYNPRRQWGDKQGGKYVPPCE